MTNADFWSRQLGGGQAPPPHVPQAAPQQGAWWQGSPHVQPPPPQASQYQDSAGPMPTYEQLRAMRADEMSQDMMELLAEYELTFEKYNNHCPLCQSTNFVRQGDRVGGVRFGTDRCFNCGGGSASALTASPEAALGATSGKAGRATRQTANGGLASTYGHHHTALPASYIPTRG